jgi:alpha-tubulin suppressor-like RCC1 family protein
MKRCWPLLLTSLVGCPTSPAQVPGESTLVTAQEKEDETPRPDAGPSAKQAPARLELGLAFEFSCLRIDKKVHCWPLGTPIEPIATLPVVPGIDDAVALAVGTGHACTIGVKGRVRCWGDNERGELGAGVADPKQAAPVFAVGVEAATAIAAAGGTTCALTTSGAVFCWGDNRYGQTGSDVVYTEDTNDLVVPTRVPAIPAATAIAVGGTTSCALTASDVWCWGESDLESERTARGEWSPEPSKLAEISSAQGLASGHGMLCALGAREVWCWGDGANAIEPRSVRKLTPATIGGISAKGMGLGDSHACVILPDGNLRCVGTDFNGMLGRGVLEEDLEPKPIGPVNGIRRVRSLALSGQTTCAITEDDQLWCWGLLPIGAKDKAKLSAEPVRIAVW